MPTISTLKRILEKKIERTRLHSQISQFLTAKGIGPSIVAKIIDELTMGEQIEKKELLVHLGTVLSKILRTTPGFDLTTSPKVIALVGPTGIGKTTTLIKLSEHLSEKKGKKTALVSIDQEKNGSKFPIDPKSFGEYDVVLIDTAGCNYYEAHRVEGVARSLSKFKDVEIHLALSASSKEVDLYGAIHQFSTLKFASLIFTKLDETLAPGTLVNVSSKSDVPISYIAYGYPLPGKIEEANGEKIAHKILTDFNDEQFHLLRRLYLQN